MAGELPFHTCDVFTEIPFSGNPLAIVEEADMLTTAQMQIIAREFNLSETIFIHKPVHPDHTAKVRIFFPTGEISFAGHPTIGCAIHLAKKLFPSKDDFETLITLEEQAGLVPVAVTAKAGAISAQFTAPIIPHAHDGALPDEDLAAAALGLNKADIGFGSHAIGLFAGGPAFLYIPVNSPETLARIDTCEPYWSQMVSAANTVGAYVYTGAGSEADYRARMFAPTAGIPEDPATGSAAAIFAAQLLASGALEAGTNRLTLLQGVEMGRRSELGLEVDIENGGITAVRVAGSAVPISSGAIRLPDSLT